MGAKDSKKEKKEISLQQESLDLLTQCSSKRMTVKEISKALEISTGTFHKMYTDYPDFKRAYYKGIQSRVIDSINSLERMCTGYYVEEEKITSMGEKTIYKKYIPPNTNAIIFFLKNRDPENWRDKWDIQIDGGERPVVIKNDLNE